MGIAAIVVTYNDDYKLEEWIKYHNEYSDEIDLHIIVDNGSDKVYLDKLHHSFPNSKIIERKFNGGCTAAYNDGILLALSDVSIDSILLIANDIKLERGGITLLYKYLNANPMYGMVSPILLEKNSNIVSDFGCRISKSLTMIPYDKGQKLEQVISDYHESAALTGGMNLASRYFYEVVGTQDEKLFMYSDEVDMGLRAKKKGIKLISIRQVKSWHQHKNRDNDLGYRHPFSSYLIGRNKVYLAKKHFTFPRVLYVFVVYCSKAIFGIIKGIIKLDHQLMRSSIWLFWGVINGLVGNMKQNRFSSPKM